MPKMYKDGSESIDVHPSQIENAKVLGWSLEKSAKQEKTIKSTGSK
jgi:hypothetical protein